MLEYAIRIGSTTKHADYALMLENKPVVLVEAKPFDADLSQDDSAQIISYGRIEDVQWVVLTNGRTLKIFDAREGKSEKECLVIEIDLAESSAHARDLSIISRESVISGDIERAIKRLAATRKALKNLEARQQELSAAFKTILLKVTGPEAEKRVDSISMQLAREAVSLFKGQSEAGTEPDPEAGLRRIYRTELAANPPGQVMLFPATREGAEFLKKYNAWGYVRVSKALPYLALYVGRPTSAVLYFGEVDSVTQPLTSKEEAMQRTGIHEKDMKMFSAGKRVIKLKPGSLVEFKDPIPLGDRHRAPRGSRYTNLKTLIDAQKVKDL
jgi:hypothetical protein